MTTDAPGRPGDLLAVTGCLLASFSLNFLPHRPGLVAAALFCVLAYAAARAQGPLAAYLKDPAIMRTLSLALAGLTALLGIVYGVSHFDEAIAPLFEELWVAAYLLAAAHRFAPQYVQGLGKPFDLPSADKAFALLTVFVACLLAAFDVAFVAWLVGLAYFLYRAGQDGTLWPFTPGRLWAEGWGRLTTIGLVLACAALGMTWALHTSFYPGYWDYGIIVDSFISSFGVSAHVGGIDLIPAILLTGICLWLTAPINLRISVQLRWAVLCALAVLCVYAFLFGLLGGSDTFILGLLLAAFGMWKSGQFPVGGQRGVPFSR
jgi:hypothetical protein